MKVRCVSVKLQTADLEILGAYPEASNFFSISTGKEYVVFGMSFYFRKQGRGCFVQILSDHNHLIDVPIKLFEVIDDRSSRYWCIKSDADGNVFLWPESFFKEFYHDDLSEDIDFVVNDFNRVKEKIVNEFEPI